MDQVALGFLVSIPGLMTLALAAALWASHRRRWRLKQVRSHACVICGTLFADAIIDDYGSIPRAELDQMDAFQRRFAAFRIRCEECASINIWTADGRPFKGIPVRE